ncbi:MAG: putative CtpA-like serine protease [Gammaproteobacteria bacterium]|nr:putative CtpA-like serine protease [Gammaproteobacteria bacterium]
MMKNRSRFALVLILGIFVGAALTLEHSVLAKKDDAVAALPYEELKAFSEVFERIKSDFVDEVDDKQLLEDAIQGMLSGLDPHSTYLDPESFKELRIGTSGEFGGLGIEVTMENGFVKVVTPIDDTPAQRAGLQPGDVITRLDDKSVKDMSLSEAVEIMRGEPETDIKLTVIREGEAKPLEFVITRAVIKITSVKARMLEEGYGYVRVTQFQNGTTDSLRRSLGNLKEQAGGELKGLVLDLRNNPGGVLDAAVSVSDTFLKDGLIVSTKGRVSNSRFTFTAKPSDYLDGTPIVVLVNGGSASASEIVAGALQDHNRGVVMGTQTFGKGSVQTILPMDNGAALKLTTARYYTPDDRSIQASGIEPDVIVENLEVRRGESGDTGTLLRESDLPGHLKNDNNGKESEPEATMESSLPSLEQDFQLREALNLLKGINIIQGG